MFKHYKETSWFYIITAVAAFVIMVLIWLNPLLPLLTRIGKTSSIIRPTLVVGLSNFILVMGGLVLFGKLRWRDFGFAHGKLKPAIIVTLGLWLLLNLGILIVTLFQGSQLVLAEHWQTRGFVLVIGALIAQLFGNALIEESLFRGFLIPQLYFKLGGSKDNKSQKALIYASFLSIIVFTVPHLGNLSNIGNGNVLETMTAIFIGGSIFTILYLRTKNLFLVIGYHAFGNTPTLIFPLSEEVTWVVTTLMGIALIFLWPMLSGLLSSKPRSNGLVFEGEG